MAGALPEHRVVGPAVVQSWRQVTFLHWPLAADVVAARLPPGLEPDLWEGQAWVSLTPFLVEGHRVSPLPAVPGLSRFPETNLRTYVRGPGGVDGLWFFSLEADSALTVVAAWAGTGVPYRWSAMGIETGETITYTARRRPPHQPHGHRIVVRPGAPVPGEEVSERDHFLTGRWRAYTTIAGLLAVVPVEHQPWPLHRAEVVEMEEDLFAAAGLPPPGAPPLVGYSTGVDARLGLVRPIGRLDHRASAGRR
jgi:uncharacterized protein YqjF (DUF2071 family)